MITMRIISLLLICLFSSGVYALSCQEMNDRIIASCSYTACKSIIYIKEVSTRPSCGRRPEVIKAPNWARKVLEYEISSEEAFEGHKLYELILKKQYWSNYLAFKNSTKYIAMVENRSEKYIRFMRTLNELDEQNIKQIEKAWKSKESKGLLIDWAWRVADWAGLFISLALLVLSVIYFTGWANKLRNAKHLVLSFLLQAGIFSTLFWLSSRDLFLVSLLSFLVPGIWFYQISVLGINFYRSKNT